MERTGSVRKIQGGGDGEGFQVPRQILRETNATLSHLLSCVLQHATSSCFDTCETHNDFARWKTELKERICVLQQQKKISSHSYGLPTNHASRKNSPLSEDNVFTMQSKASTEQGKDCFETFEPLRKKQKVHMNVNIVPGLPKRVEDIVQLWRKGIKSQDLRRLRDYSTPEKRRENIPGYRDKDWEARGQKRRFQRIMSVMKVVAAFKSSNPPFNLHEEGDDEEWNEALRRFFKFAKENGKSISISSIISSKQQWVDSGNKMLK